jgi:hypothetical protein
MSDSMAGDLSMPLNVISRASMNIAPMLPYVSGLLATRLQTAHKTERAVSNNPRRNQETEQRHGDEHNGQDCQ